MANNIINIQSVNPDTLEFQNYQPTDSGLISSFTVNDISFVSNFNSIEYHILDSNKNLIVSDYNFLNYSILDGDITITPENDLVNLGFTEGQYYSLYHFITPLLNSTPDNRYFISEISSDRTELRLSSNILTSQSIIDGYNNFISQYVGQNYYPDFYLNFGDNDLVIANNILLDNNTILIKLYEALPPQFDIKSELWVVNKLADSISYFIELITVFTNTENIVNLKGPNLNINLKNQINNSTDYINYTGLQTSSSLSNQLNNILNNKSIRLNIDYTDYNNFIHFSSAETRLENFYYKLTLIEQYNRQYISSSSSPANYYLTSSQNIYLTKIKEIEEGLDGYEYHLYYGSGSTSWPKSNSVQPYINYASTSSQGTTWLTNQLITASLYDSENKDALINSIPLYLKEDPTNAPYELFVEMLGQNFDTLYLYYGEITNKYSSDNRIDYGASKDVVSDILKDFGVKIYQNNFSTTDLYSSFLGITSNLGLLPPTGSELITNYVTASSDIIPLDNANTELYKRIYHNLPLLFKKKGTVEGLKLLINTYGIPDTILRINEFGGKNKINANDWDQFQDQFNYEFFTTSSGYLIKSIPSGIDSSSLSTVEFRFKSTGIPLISGFSQSLASFSGSFFNVVLEYSGSGYVSSSYNGSIPDVNNQYGTLKLIDKNNASASVYLPFFNEDWWSILITTTNNTSSLFAKNKIYSGYDGNKIGFQASSSVLGGGYWIDSASTSNFYLSYPTNKTITGKIYTPFSGSFQELRFYSTQISQSVFDDYVMNPYSIESNQLSGSQSSYNSLIFRAPLGSVLDISGSTKNSVHPQAPITILGTNTYILSGSYSFLPNTEITYLDQFPAGIKNIISNKIKIENTILPGGNVLSSNRSLQQNYVVSESYTRDTNYVEVAFSPQNEINDDITAQLGYFNIGDYIGDPRQLTNTNTTFYPDFNKIRDDYFLKYSGSYNTFDYIRLIKYFDNSLFKLIKDFTPARTGLAAGVVVKQHLLERNRYSPAQISYEFTDYSASIKSFSNNYSESVLYKTTGGTGGSLPDLNGSISSSFTYPGAINITQSWSESFVGPKGLSLILHQDQEEFFNGEFKGSEFTATTQDLNLANEFKTNSILPLLQYKIRFYDGIAQSSYDSYITRLSTFSSNDFNTLPNIGGTIWLKDNQFMMIPIYASGSSDDQSLFLENADNIQINYSNGNKVTYNILSRVKYDSFYYYTLLSVVGTPYSLDNQVLEYSASADRNITGDIPLQYYINNGYTMYGAKNSNTLPIEAWNVTYNPIGYFTGSWKNPNTSYPITSSLFTIKDFPNIQNLYFELSFDIQGDNGMFGNTTTVRALIGMYDRDMSTTTNITTTKLNSISAILADSVVTAITSQGSSVPVNFNAIIQNDSPSIGYYNNYFVLLTTTDNNWAITASNVVLTITPTSNLPQSGSTDIVFMNPYFNNIFESTDYDVTYGSIDAVTPSKYIEKIDYNTYNSVNSSYFTQLVSGSATRADVKDYYYNLKRHINPRYVGSRNTSDDFNTLSISQSVNLQNKLLIPLSPSNKSGVAYKYNTTIYEFNGVGKFVELPSFNYINLTHILSTDVTTSAISIPPKDPQFEFIYNNQLPPNTTVGLNKYNFPGAATNVTTINTQLFSPANITSEYIFTPNITITTNAQASNNQIYFSADSSSAGFYVPTNKIINAPNGYYTTSSISSSIISPFEFVNTISKSLFSGEAEWYATLYSANIPIPFKTDAYYSPLPLDALFTSSNFGDSLVQNSTFKIVSASGVSGSTNLTSCALYINYNLNKTVFYGSSTNTSLLIWKKTQGSNVMINPINTTGIAKGNFLPPNVSPFIQNNLDTITKNFGDNT